MMNDLLFLTHVSQVQDVALAQKRLVNPRIVTADLATAARLEELGIPFIDEWSLLTAEDLEATWRTSWELACNWWNEAFQGQNCPDFDLAEAAKNELYWPFEWCLNARLIYDRLLDAHPVREIFGYFLPATGVCQCGPAPWPLAIASHSHAVLYWCAAQRNLPVHSLEIVHPLTVERGAANPFNPPAVEPHTDSEPVIDVELQARTSGKFDCVGDAHLRANWNKPCRNVMMMLPYLAPQEATDFVRMFTQTPGWRLFRVNHWHVSHESITWPDPACDQTQAICKAKAEFDARQHYTGNFPELFANPFLRFQFDRIWAEFVKAARLGVSFRKLLREYPASLVLFGYDGFLVERVFKRILREVNVPTTALIHGGFNHVTGVRTSVSDADHMMVWGQQDVDLMARFGLERSNAVLVGSSRYGDLYRSTRRKEQATRRTSQAPARRLLGVPEEKPTIVLLTATTMGLSAPIANPDRHREAWRQIKLLAARRPDLTFLIKPHPWWDEFAFYEVICQNGPPNLKYLREGTLANVLAASDVAVLVNYCTTAGLESMLHGLPVVLLRNALYPIEPSENSLQHGGAISVDDPKGFEELLDRLIRDPTARQAALAAAEPVLSKCLDAGEESAYERIFRHCDRVALEPVRSGRKVRRHWSVTRAGRMLLRLRAMFRIRLPRNSVNR